MVATMRRVAAAALAAIALQAGSADASGASLREQILARWDQGRCNRVAEKCAKGIKCDDCCSFAPPSATGVPGFIGQMFEDNMNPESCNARIPLLFEECHAAAADVDKPGDMPAAIASCLFAGTETWAPQRTIFVEVDRGQVEADTLDISFSESRFAACVDAFEDRFGQRLLVWAVFDLRTLIRDHRYAMTKRLRKHMDMLVASGDLSTVEGVLGLPSGKVTVDASPTVDPALEDKCEKAALQCGGVELQCNSCCEVAVVAGDNDYRCAALDDSTCQRAYKKAKKCAEEVPAEDDAQAEADGDAQAADSDTQADGEVAMDAEMRFTKCLSAELLATAGEYSTGVFVHGGWNVGQVSAFESTLPIFTGVVKRDDKGRQFAITAITLSDDDAAAADQ